MSDFVLDASVALQWFLEDESGREYSLAVLKTLSKNRAAVPSLWLYEVGNGLVMAHRRKRITVEQMDEFGSRLLQLPIEVEEQVRQSFSRCLSWPELMVLRTMTQRISRFRSN